MRVLAMACFMMAAVPASAQDLDDLKKAIDGFGKTTMTGGGGWESYQNYLHDDWSRWSSWQPVMTKEEFLGGLRDWWEAGNRQSARETETLDLRVVGEVGIGRFRTKETYSDPNGNQTGIFNGYVDHVWKYEGEGWRLLAINIYRLPDPDAE